MSIQIQKVTDASFKKYGRVLTGEYDVDALIEKMQELPFETFVRTVQIKIIETGKREEICGDCQWNRICQKQPSRWLERV